MSLETPGGILSAFYGILRDVHRIVKPPTVHGLVGRNSEYAVLERGASVGMSRAKDCHKRAEVP